MHKSGIHVSKTAFESSRCFIELQCKQIRAPAKQQEYKRRTVTYAQQTGRFLGKEALSKLFIEILNDLNVLYLEINVSQSYCLYVY